MKKQQATLVWFHALGVCLLVLLLGCARSPLIEISKDLSGIVKEYRQFTIYPWQTGYINTKIHLRKGSLFSIITESYQGRYYLNVKVEEYSVLDTYFAISPLDGDLSIGVFASRNFGENCELEIIVWKEKDWDRITKFLQDMKQKNPKSIDLDTLLMNAGRLKEIQIAEVKTSQEIEKTKLEIQELKEESISKKEEPVKIEPEEKPPSQTKSSIVEMEKKPKIDQLEAKLAKLTGILNQLDEMKKKLAEERKKSILLAKKLEEREKKEKELVEKLKQREKKPPIVVITSPKDESKVEVNIIHISGVAEDDQGLVHLEIYINNKPIKKKEGRDLKVTGGINPKRVIINERIPLEKGENQIRIRAVDSDGLWAEKTLTIQRSKIRRNVWAVIIGINDYPNVRKLKFAVNDAKVFYDHLVSHNYIPAENVTLLLDWEATLTKLRSTLGTHLKRKAGKDDMVIIYFAGHGSTEKDVMSPDGDGLEKYLLPYDADPKDLYASALPMREISHIFNRVQSERLVFLADSCYSGASGGRTIGIAGTRSNISENFLDRVASGKGRVIITASGSNEVSAENEVLQHGVFTYYLIEGLQGKADIDKDGLITVDEVYRYVSEQVPRATGQEQHPVKKGTVEGRLILGVIE